MRANTVRDLGAMVRSSRRAQGMTQADLADRLRGSREWVVRLEGGHPRLEAQKVLDALTVLGLALDVEQQPRVQAPVKRAPAKKAPVKRAPAKKAPVKRAPAKKATGRVGQTRWVTKAVAKEAPARTVPTKKASVKKTATAKSSARDADPFDALFTQRRR